MTRQKDVTDFVADFHNYPHMKRVLEREKVTMPSDWKCLPDGFKIVEDSGRILTLAFWDWDKDEQVGDTVFKVDYEDVECWA